MDAIDKRHQQINILDLFPEEKKVSSDENNTTPLCYNGVDEIELMTM